MKYKILVFTFIIFSLLFISCKNKHENQSKIIRQKIAHIKPVTADVGETVTIYGTGFGVKQGKNYISFKETKATEYFLWNDTVIKVKVPIRAVSGYINITVNGLKTDGKLFTLYPQEWMEKNLDVDRYQNGDKIPEVKDPYEWSNLRTGAWCYYDNDPANRKKYGKLYNWYAVNDKRGLAPEGWHIPSSNEWEEFGIRQGFDEITGGYRGLNGAYEYIGSYGHWWSSTEFGVAHAYYRSFNGAVVSNSFCYKDFGKSVRCIKNK